jgi:fatty acid-binding protein DegV
LRRGGRISGLRAVNWRSRKVHPVLTFTKNGELVIEGKARNEKRLVDYLLNKIKTTGEDVVENFGKGIIYVARSSRSKLYDTILAAVRERYPEAEIRERIIGPIIGAHFGLDAVAIVHDGIARQSNK